MKSDLEKPLVIKIKKLNINEAYFFGQAEIDGKEYKINVQGHWKEKLIKLPISHPQKDKILIRLTGKEDTTIENIVALGENQNGLK